MGSDRRWTSGNHSGCDALGFRENPRRSHRGYQRDGELSYELIDRLQDRGIRIVVLTGYANVALQNGKAAVVLQKPAREEVLIASLRKRQ